MTSPGRLTSAVAGRLARRVATTPFAIFSLFACFYTLTYQGRVNTYDGQSMFETTRALGDRLSLSLARPAFGVAGRDGLIYSKYGIAQSVLELPFYLLGKLIGLPAHSKGPQVAQALAMLANPLVMAVACVLCYAVACALGFTRATALRATLVVGVATSFWPYSKSDFSEPLLTVTLLAAALCVLRGAQPGQDSRRTRRLDLLAGCALGVAILAKYVAVIFVPFFCLYVIVAAPLVQSLVHRLRRQVTILAPIVVSGCIVLLVNDLRFGSIFKTGYTAIDRPFTGDFVHGLLGLTLGPYRGLVYYDPLLFVGLLALPMLLWRRPREALLAGGLVLLSIVFYADYPGWDSGPAWGPRYLIPVLPFLLWPLLELGCFGSAEAPRTTVLTALCSRRPLRMALRVVMTGVVAVSVVVQALGVCMNYYVHDFYWQVGMKGHSFAVLKDSLRASPIAMAIWSIPLNFHFAFTGKLLAHGYASSQYLFGPPFPTNPDMPQELGAFYIQTFWFTLLPHPALVGLVGLVALGAGMFLSARVLWRRFVRRPASAPFATSAGLAPVAAR